MNIRYRVLCERIKALARARGATLTTPPATEEQIRETEEKLGFSLPPMLRMLYLEVANGGFNIINPEHGFGDAMFSASGNMESWVVNFGAGYRYPTYHSLVDGLSRSGWRFPPHKVEALQRHRGAYVDCTVGDDVQLPDGFVYMAFLSKCIAVYLDGPTGYIYLNDEGKVSFCAPSVEDWLELLLDASRSVQTSYYPHVELDTAFEANTQHVGSDTAPASSLSEDERLSAAQLTQQLREENLSDDEPDPTEHFAQQDPQNAFSGVPRVKAVGWTMQRTRHQLIRHIYEFITIYEDEVFTRQGEEAQPDLYIRDLQSLIDAEANLACMIDDIQRGRSKLFEYLRRHLQDLYRLRQTERRLEDDSGIPD